MFGIYDVFISLFCTLVLLAIAHIFIESAYGISLAYLIYIVLTRQFSHYVEKRKLVVGDLIFIKYRGKYRKAFITHLSSFTNAVQIQFFDKELNIDLVRHNWYPLSRIIVPEYMGGRAAKLLFSDSEE